MKIESIIHKSKDGGYWVEVPALPGCVTQADTMKELKVNIAEAVEGWMRVHEARGIKKAAKSRSGNVKVMRLAV